MQPMTLREAAQRTSRSITTLRRYIRSGRLQAEKRQGRFGPEYFVSEASLNDAGLDPREAAENGSLPVRRGAPRPEITSLGLRADRMPKDAVPMTLYQELQMKHEQLLVQYGMMRAGGMKALELRGELDRVRTECEQLQQDCAALRSRRGDETQELQRQLREANLELEARALEIAALQEKVRGLEMLTRNAARSESIEQQFSELVDQRRRVERLAEPEPADPAAENRGRGRQWRVAPSRPLGPPPGEPEH